MAEARDRDDEGRARQLRPRDALGRPLPYGAVGVAQVPDIARSPLDTLDLARRLVRQGRAFSAHEVLESQWKYSPVEYDVSTLLVIEPSTTMKRNTG